LLRATACAISSFRSSVSVRRNEEVPALARIFTQAFTRSRQPIPRHHDGVFGLCKLICRTLLAAIAQGWRWLKKS